MADDLEYRAVLSKIVAWVYKSHFVGRMVLVNRYPLIVAASPVSASNGHFLSTTFIELLARLCYTT